MTSPEFIDNHSWFKQLFYLSPDPTWIIEGNRFVECNDAAVTTLGYANREELLNVHPSKLSPPSQPDGVDSFSKANLMMEIAREHGLHRFEWIHTKADGTKFTAEVTLLELELTDKRVFYCVWRDISDRKLNEQKIQYMAYYDALTGLPNRRLFNDRLQQALSIAKREKSLLALMFIDLDKFKPINDELGHHAGDMLLRDAALRMQNCLRESDTVARIGGDEFVVLLPAIEAVQDAMLVAEKIRCVLNQPFTQADRSLSISSSTGVAVYPEHGHDERQLFINADIAMYAAKEGGRNAVKCYQPDMR